MATLPRSAAEIEARGVYFVLQMARHCPSVKFRLIGRPWRRKDTATSAIQAILADESLRNVELTSGMQVDMASIYHTSDFTIIPYTKPDGGKECPLSLVESLACGVPVLISKQASLAPFIERTGSGRIFDLDPGEFRKMLYQAQSDYDVLSSAALLTARRYFDAANVFSAYRNIYESNA